MGNTRTSSAKWTHLTQPEFNPNSDPESPTRPKNQSGSEVNLTRLDPFWDPEGQTDSIEPKKLAQNWVEPEKTGRVWQH